MKQTDVTRWAEEMAERIDLLRESVALQQMKTTEVRKEKYGRNARERIFSKGDKVLIRTPGLAAKMEEAWTGPWEIVRQCGPVTYEVKIRDRQKKITHLNAIKKFEERDVQVKRLTVLADPDTPEDEVDDMGGPGKLEGKGTCEGFNQQQLDTLLKKHS